MAERNKVSVTFLADYNDSLAWYVPPLAFYPPQKESLGTAMESVPLDWASTVRSWRTVL